MKLQNLSIHDILGLSHAEIENPSGLLMFYGRNGQGKSSLLEALGVFLTGEKGRNSKEGDIVRAGAKRARVVATWDDGQEWIWERTEGGSFKGTLHHRPIKAGQWGPAVAEALTTEPTALLLSMFEDGVERLGLKWLTHFGAGWTWTQVEQILGEVLAKVGRSIYPEDVPDPLALAAIAHDRALVAQRLAKQHEAILSALTDEVEPKAWTKREPLRLQFEELKALTATARRKHREHQKEEERQQAQSTLDQLSSVNGACPTCGSPVGTTRKEQLEAKIQNIDLHRRSKEATQAHEHWTELERKLSGAQLIMDSIDRWERRTEEEVRLKARIEQERGDEFSWKRVQDAYGTSGLAAQPTNGALSAVVTSASAWCKRRGLDFAIQTNLTKRGLELSLGGRPESMLSSSERLRLHWFVRLAGAMEQSAPIAAVDELGLMDPVLRPQVMKDLLDMSRNAIILAAMTTPHVAMSWQSEKPEGMRAYLVENGIAREMR